MQALLSWLLLALSLLVAYLKVSGYRFQSSENVARKLDGGGHTVKRRRKKFKNDTSRKQRLISGGVDGPVKKVINDDGTDSVLVEDVDTSQVTALLKPNQTSQSLHHVSPWYHADTSEVSATEDAVDAVMKG